jgi:hypothetical protein
MGETEREGAKLEQKTQKQKQTTQKEEADDEAGEGRNHGFPEAQVRTLEVRTLEVREFRFGSGGFSSFASVFGFRSGHWRPRFGEFRFGSHY